MNSGNYSKFLVFILASGASSGVCAGAAADANAPDPAVRRYLSGNGLLNRGLYELAAAEYRVFLSVHPTHEKSPVARYGLAVSLSRLGDHEAAVTELTRLHQRAGFTYAAEVGALLGQCRLAAKRYGPAAKAFGWVVQHHGKHDLADAAAAGAVEALYLDGKHADAIRRAEMLASRWPKSSVRERAAFYAALSRMAQREYEKAARAFDALRALSPRGRFADRATLLAAQCHHQANSLQDAAQRYRSLIAQKTSAHVADALLGLGRLLVQAGKPDEAGPFLDRLIESHGESALLPSARLLRGRAWFDQKRYDRAAQVFEAVAHGGGALADDAAYWIAKCKLRAGDFDEAARRLEAALKAHPDSDLRAEMAYDRGIALVRAGNDKAAATALEAFRNTHPDHTLAAEALELSATLEHQQGRYDQSQAHCRSFLRQHADHRLAPAVAFLSAENKFLAGRDAEAGAQYRRFLERHPNDLRAARARLRLGTVLYRARQFDEAERLLAQVAPEAANDPAFRSAVLALGDIHFQRGEWEQAERRLESYVALDADADGADDAWLKLGLARQRRGRHREALAAYDHLLERFEQSPHRLHALFERGQTLIALEKPDEAAAAFEQVLAADPQSRFAAHALNHLGTLAMQRGDFAAAARRFEQTSTTSSPEAVKARAGFQRGQALMAARQYAAAADAFAQFIREHSSDEQATHARAQLAIALSRQDKHADAIEAIARITPDTMPKLGPALRATLHYEKAWCLRELGKTDEASAAYRELLELGADPGLTAHALLALAGIESDAKRYDAAAKSLHRLREIVARNQDGVPRAVQEQATYALAVCNFEKGRLEEAADLFETLINDFPDSELLASASFYAGQARLESGAFARATKHFKRVADRFASDPACGPALLRLGECLAARQDWHGSEQAFARYLERFADQEHWYQARFGIGWARENQRRHDEAMRAYRQVVERHQGPTAARAQFQIGECLFAKKRYAEAVRALLQVDILYAYPEWSAAALYEAGRCFEHLGKPADARRQFEAVTEKHKETRWATLASQRRARLSKAALPGR